MEIDRSALIDDGNRRFREALEHSREIGTSLSGQGAQRGPGNIVSTHWPETDGLVRRLKIDLQVDLGGIDGEYKQISTHDHDLLGISFGHVDVDFPGLKNHK